MRILIFVVFICPDKQGEVEEHHVKISRKLRYGVL